MKPVARRFIFQASQSSASNALGLLVSLATTLILPKILGVADYSFWQLYVFYTGYVGVLQFGWVDGIYLRYGGHSFEQLERAKFSAQFWMLVATQVVISALVVLSAWSLVADANRSFILSLTGVAVLILGTRVFFLFIWQATNLIGHYAQSLALEYTVFIIAVSVWFLMGKSGYQGLIVCDLSAKGVSLFVSAYWCRGLVIAPLHWSRRDVAEAWLNVSVGIKLMLANLAGILMVGIVRLTIERHWSVITFGKVSLSLSVSTLVMGFVNAVGVVVFPTLRRIDPARKPELFLTLRRISVPVAALLLFLYFPLRILLGMWLPDYAESLRYMGLLFPIFLFEGRMSLVVNPFLKDMRAERSMLLVNLVSLALAGILSLISAIWLDSLELTVASILLLIVFRATTSELVLWSRLGVHALTSLLPEIALASVFVCAAWFQQVLPALAIYGACYIGFLALSYQSLRRSSVLFRGFMR